MLTIRNFGTKSYLELKEKLVAKGFLQEDEALPGMVEPSDEPAEVETESN